MDKPTALLIVEVDTSDSEITRMIADIPQPGLHLSILVVQTTEALPVYAYGGPPYGPIIVPEDWNKEYEAKGAELADRANAIEKVLQGEGVEGDIVTTYRELSTLDHDVAMRASLSDYVFLPPSLNADSEHFRKALTGLLYDSPAGAILNANSVMGTLKAKRPFIAWDRSLPATRAVHRALPILKQAEEVTVAVFDPKIHHNGSDGDPGANLAAWLSRHGCNVTVHQFPSGGIEIADAISGKAVEMGADLVVMGAYARSRTRQLLLGGTTQTMVTQDALPVMLAH